MAVIHGEIILGYDFQLVIWVVAFADALDRLVNSLAFVVARQENAYRGLVSVVLLDAHAGQRPTQYRRYEASENARDQQAEHRDKGNKNEIHVQLPRNQHVELDAHIIAA